LFVCLNNERSATGDDHEPAATAIDESGIAYSGHESGTTSSSADFYSVTDVESQSSHESTTAVDDDEPETVQEVSKSAAESVEVQ
jgi:hypothetical protein